MWCLVRLGGVEDNVEREYKCICIYFSVIGGKELLIDMPLMESVEVGDGSK
jgi:hypothetical protein